MQRVMAVMAALTLERKGEQVAMAAASWELMELEPQDEAILAVVL